MMNKTINTIDELRALRLNLLDEWMVQENRYNEAINWDIVKIIFENYKKFNHKWLTKKVQALMKAIGENSATVTWKHIKAVREVYDELSVGFF